MPSLMDMKARLLGIRLVEDTEDYITIRTPRWMNDEAKRRIAREVTADAQVVGKPVRFDIGARLIRIYRERS